jgi:1-aminocyclopropane-1-carboxylate deaminase/D-cysteine desulfhydrase-like pyridoxal-dependent ACC family enzyme
MSEVIRNKIDEVLGRLAVLPRVSLAHLPTPLDVCPNLTNALQGPTLFIKRDDCTGLAFGGNKTRQLEYILGAALARGADCVIQGAASQSNHARQLAAAGAKLGLQVYLTPKQDARSFPIQGNYLVSHLLGAEICPVPAESSMKEAKERLANRLRAQGKHPYIVGMGATETLVLAAVTYVGAYLEIAQQMLDRGVGLPGWIYCTSQGGTQAGLLLGARLLGADTKVVGVNPMRPEDEAYIPPNEIADLVSGAAKLLGYEVEVADEAIVNDGDYVGPGYGQVSEAGREAMELLGKHEGILVDPVYSGKGLSGLINHIRRGRLSRDETVVFVHTGGLPAIFAYASDLMGEGKN